jgi:hypothetical protein
MMATVEVTKMKTKLVDVDLSPPVHQELRRPAADEEASMAALARKAVEEYVVKRAKGGGK